MLSVSLCACTMSVLLKGVGIIPVLEVVTIVPVVVVVSDTIVEDTDDDFKHSAVPEKAPSYPLCAGTPLFLMHLLLLLFQVNESQSDLSRHFCPHSSQLWMLLSYPISLPQRSMLTSIQGSEIKSIM